MTQPVRDKVFDSRKYNLRILGYGNDQQFVCVRSPVEKRSRDEFEAQTRDILMMVSAEKLARPFISLKAFRQEEPLKVDVGNNIEVTRQNLALGIKCDRRSADNDHTAARHVEIMTGRLCQQFKRGPIVGR